MAAISSSSMYTSGFKASSGTRSLRVGSTCGGTAGIHELETSRDSIDLAGLPKSDNPDIEDADDPGPDLKCLEFEEADDGLCRG
jgi:hypothetical protein